MAVSGTSWDRSANGRPLGRAPRRALQFGPHPVALILPGAPVVEVDHNVLARTDGRDHPSGPSCLDLDRAIPNPQFTCPLVHDPVVARNLGELGEWDTAAPSTLAHI